MTAKQTTNDLVNLFLKALGWNAFSYAIYRASYTLLSFILVAHLSQKDFTLWATLMSCIFLALLWLDCGLRKSLPRYCPEFSQSISLHSRFLRWIGSLQLLFLVICVPIFYWLLPIFFGSIGTHIETNLRILATMLFFAEGCMALMRLLYHAHFWNKEFNSLSTTILLAEVVISISSALMLRNSSYILYIVVGLRCVGSLLITGISIWRMPQPKIIESKDRLPNRLLVREFITHSGAMWLANSIKSFTERNFLLPFITYSLGPATGITFKLTNDAALFFYRSALKTIGTSDTALLSYARHYRNGTRQAFTSLIKTVCYITLPLLAIALFGACCAPYVITTRLVMAPFLILTCSYLLEVMLSPYERLLEVSRDYTSLAIAYIPYCLIVGLLFYHKALSQLGFLSFLCIIQGLRIISSLLIVWRAHKAL